MSKRLKKGNRKKTWNLGKGGVMLQTAEFELKDIKKSKKIRKGIIQRKSTEVVRDDL